MQQQLSYQTYNNKNYSYQNSNQKYQQKNIEKASTIPINYNQINRNNYHYNYSPNNIITNNNLNHNINHNNLNNNNLNNYTNNNNITNMNNINNMNNNQNYQNSQNYHNNKTNTQQKFYKPQSQHKYRPQSQKQQKQYNHSNLQSKPIFNQIDTNIAIKFIPQLFPNTFKLLDLNKFTNQNIQLRKKLILQLETIKQKNIILKNKTIIKQQEEKQKTSTRDTTPKRQIRDKSSNLYNNQRNKKTQSISRFGQNIDENQQLSQLMQMKRQKQQQIQQQKQKLTELQYLNQTKQEQIQKLQCQALHQSIHQTPLLRQKQQAIQYLSIQVEWLNDKNLQLRRLVNNKSAQDDVFEMYEKMCRQVQSLRKQNNKKSQKLKKLFEKTNKITGKQENVNMFLMNLKV